jgi:hypothetical protein
MHKKTTLIPQRGVALPAQKGLTLRKLFHRGGTMVGVARARDLQNRRNLSPQTINRMVSYFARHAVDRKASGFGNDTNPSAGYIAWLLWGGDPGATWAYKQKQKLDQ